MSGTHKDRWGAIARTSKGVEFEEIAILRIREGKIVSQRGVVDNLAALRQRGVVPTPYQRS
jgi:predicted ester cyclase